MPTRQEQGEIFPTVDDLERVIKEGIPRDWFGYLDLNVISETLLILTGEDRGTEENQSYDTPVLYGSVGREIAPAIIKGLVAPKESVLMTKVRSLIRGARLDTSLSTQIDSWGYQLYGDLVARDGRGDSLLKKKIRCLIENDSQGELFHFLPAPTREGITAFLKCFGFDILILPTSYRGASLGAMYWDVPRRFAWDRTDVGGWNGVDALIFFADTGDEDKNGFAQALIRRSKVFGTKVTVLMTGSDIFP
jgi:hypothetical protein